MSKALLAALNSSPVRWWSWRCLAARIVILRNNSAPRGARTQLILSNSALRLGATRRRNGLYAVAQSSKIIERLNLHRICRFGNFDDKDLVLVLFHSLMNVCEMNEVIFRHQGIGSIFVVDGDRPSRADCNSPKLPDALS
jgi:hypothetical protein